LITCPGVVGVDVNGVIFFSYPTVYLTTGGSVNYDDYTNAITGGTDITDATVVVTNDTTEESITLTFNPASGGNMGYYGGSQEFIHTAGQNVSVKITAGENTFTGASNQTPNSFTFITSPTEGANIYFADQPFDLVWTFNAGSYPATHIAVYIVNANTDPHIYKWAIVPINQESYEISGLPVANGYYITAWPVNIMSFTGGGSLIGYVGSDSMTDMTVMVNIITIIYMVEKK
ncbi:MAG: hypothetical protein JSV25_09315, partial [Spirochaetota bacterium]